MGRKGGKLKSFLNERVNKFINLKNILHQGILCMCLEFPRYSKNSEKFDNANEEIFKEWEEVNGRKYKSYKLQKDVLKSAIRKSRFFEVWPENKKLIFREKSPEELVIAKVKQKIGSKAINPLSPASSGYETGSPSYIQVATPLEEVFSPSCTVSPQMNISSTEERKAECAVQPVEKFPDQPMDTSNLSESEEWKLFPMLDDTEVSKNSTEKNVWEAAECAVQPVEKFADQSMDTSNLFESGELKLFPMLDDTEVSKNSTEKNVWEADQEMAELYSKDSYSLDFSDLVKFSPDSSTLIGNESETLTVPAETWESYNTENVPFRRDWEESLAITPPKNF